eukprot:1672597-Amphidinium_carterae.1
MVRWPQSDATGRHAGMTPAMLFLGPHWWLTRYLPQPAGRHCLSSVAELLSQNSQHEADCLRCKTNQCCFERWSSRALGQLDQLSWRSSQNLRKQLAWDPSVLLSTCECMLQCH